MDTSERLNALVPLLNWIVKRSSAVYFPPCTEEDRAAFGRVSRSRSEALPVKYRASCLGDVNPAAFIVSLSKVDAETPQEEKFFRYILSPKKGVYAGLDELVSINTPLYHLYAAVYTPWKLLKEDKTVLLWRHGCDLTLALTVDTLVHPEKEAYSTAEWLDSMLSEDSSTHAIKHLADNTVVAKRVALLWEEERESCLEYFKEGAKSRAALHLITCVAGISDDVPAEEYDKLVVGEGALITNVSDLKPYLRSVSSSAFKELCKEYSGISLDGPWHSQKKEIGYFWRVMNERLTEKQLDQVKKNSKLKTKYTEAMWTMEADIEGRRCFSYAENYPVPVEPNISWSTFE